jgi:hypothetical protein
MQIDKENYFEAAQGLHWYCVDNHSGQSSELYAIQCELDYTPSLSEDGVNEDNASAFFYEALEVGSIEAPKLLELIQEVMADD